MRTIMKDMHTCPGGCRRVVVNHRFACLDCWTRLPAPMRAAIRSTYQRDHTKHARAMVDAMEWYRDTAHTTQNN